MQRSQIHLSPSHRQRLATYAILRGTTHSALIRQAPDEYLATQAPLDKRALRRQAFGAWAANADALSVAQLHSEERCFD